MLSALPFLDSTLWKCVFAILMSTCSLLKMCVCHSHVYFAHFWMGRAFHTLITHRLHEKEIQSAMHLYHWGHLVFAGELPSPSSLSFLLSSNLEQPCLVMCMCMCCSLFFLSCLGFWWSLFSPLSNDQLLAALWTDVWMLIRCLCGIPSHFDQSI